MARASRSKRSRELRISGELFRQDFYGDGSVQTCISCAIDFTHPASTDRTRASRKVPNEFREPET